MRKIQNDGLQVVGIILSLIGIATVVQPLIRAMFGKTIVYKFLGLLPEGWPSLTAWAVILVIGLVLVSITKPLSTGRSE
ncbi:hypothetical protein [Paenibacillus sacheonensis]|uniref:Uncharacterized protein n=1 Tax=Paenibacillus sacheonensis TaxID=742054 RepID=A0A7X4YRS4_9BACL|nr:hypothetical protein [Paenibacillus sacheonensis]MBM7567518.1 hypothetical protein [Paenibacillus sacheonensis]NBC71377.1 hypothetical protein [Paenibacillus sacheonensis]